MKSYINRFLIGSVLVATAGMTSCVGDLDQFPQDERTMTASDFKNNPKEYLAGAMGKCYSGIAIAGQSGAGSSDISRLDNGRSCWSRAIFMLNEFTTDECN
ncbi:MAG: RagB/SusD family nutrient uptake outer membrane protein, partial [Muribaculaceae bacterium]|nr:RagB/SusD family nutrient uptake outer membrane protein [Muribaculaceae bacterium]